MKKNILIGVIALFSAVLSAGNLKECNDYWNPKIEEDKKIEKDLQCEWDTMDHKAMGSCFVEEALSRAKHRRECSEAARRYCLINGLEKSTAKYELL